MVRKLLFGLIIFSAFIVNAQDFALDTSGVSVSDSIYFSVTETDGFTNEYVGTLHIAVTNTSSSSKTFKLQRTNISEDSLSSHLICKDELNGSCYSGDLTPAFTIVSGESFKFLIHATFNTEPYGYSLESYKFYEDGNESNFVDIKVYYYVGSATIINTVENNFSFSKPFPNPANENVNFSYNIATQGYVTIHDVTGKQISKIELNQGLDRATFNTSNINNGIYFYNVFVDGVKTYTDKFIVRH